MVTHSLVNWPYSGTLDAAKNVLTLDSEGPGMLGDGSMSKYQDMIEFKSYDQRVLSSQFLDDQGIWRPFMKAVYTRKKS